MLVLEICTPTQLTASITYRNVGRLIRSFVYGRAQELPDEHIVSRRSLAFLEEPRSSVKDSGSKRVALNVGFHKRRRDC